MRLGTVAGWLVALQPAACSHDWDDYFYEPAGSSTSASSSAGGGDAGDCMPKPVSATFDAGCDTVDVQGYYFNVQANARINVTGFEAVSETCNSCSNSCDGRGVSIWYRKGGTENKESPWKKLGHVDDFTPQCAHTCPITPKRVPISFCVPMQAPEIVGFYIVMTSGEGFFESSNTPSGTPVTSDDFITLFAGSGQMGVGEFMGTVDPDRAWKGNILYEH